MDIRPLLIIQQHDDDIIKSNGAEQNGFTI